MKQHCQGGRQYSKIARHPQRRSRHRQDEPQAQNESDQEAQPTSGKKVQEKKTEKDSSSSDELPDVPF